MVSIHLSISLDFDNTMHKCYVHILIEISLQLSFIFFCTKCFDDVLNELVVEE